MEMNSEKICMKMTSSRVVMRWVENASKILADMLKWIDDYLGLPRTEDGLA